MDKQELQARVLIFAIHYRSDGAILELLKCLQSMKARKEVRLIIADNSTSAEEVAPIRAAIQGFADVELLESPTNRGYFGGARFALDRYLAQGHKLPDWVIVCNHDILIEDKDFFTKLLREDPKTAGVIAPCIQALPGRVDQNPFMRHRPSRLRWTQLRFISSHYAVAAIWDWFWRRKSALRSRLRRWRPKSFLRDPTRRESIYAAQGSFFIFSRRYFETGGFLDGNLFLYGEEISVAEICRSLRLPVVYEPSLWVLHNEHQSTGTILNRFTYECQKNALQYLTSRYWLGSKGL
jgi:GT2 family glycosyltransferase